MQTSEVQGLQPTRTFSIILNQSMFCLTILRSKSFRRSIKSMKRFIWFDKTDVNTRYAKRHQNHRISTVFCGRTYQICFVKNDFNITGVSKVCKNILTRVCKKVTYVIKITALNFGINNQMVNYMLQLIYCLLQKPGLTVEMPSFCNYKKIHICPAYITLESSKIRLKLYLQMQLINIDLQIITVWTGVTWSTPMQPKPTDIFS